MTGFDSCVVPNVLAVFVERQLPYLTFEVIIFTVIDEMVQVEEITFLRINDYLERGLKTGKLSKNTYNLLKEALIQSVLDKLGREEPPFDYATNY